MLQEICAEIHVGDLRRFSPVSGLNCSLSGSLFPQFTPQQVRDGLNSAFAELKPAAGGGKQFRQRPRTTHPPRFWSAAYNPIWLLLLGPFWALDGRGVLDFLPSKARQVIYLPAVPFCYSPPLYAVFGGYRIGGIQTRIQRKQRGDRKLPARIRRIQLQELFRWSCRRGISMVDGRQMREDIGADKHTPLNTFLVIRFQFGF